MKTVKCVGFSIPITPIVKRLFTVFAFCYATRKDYSPTDSLGLTRRPNRCGERSVASLFLLEDTTLIVS